MNKKKTEAPEPQTKKNKGRDAAKNPEPSPAEPSAKKEAKSGATPPRQTDKIKAQAVEPKPKETAQKIAALEDELAAKCEEVLRKQADLQNYRRRMQKEKEEAIQFANHSLIKELLEVLDNFERALASHQNEKNSSKAMNGLFEGLELVEKQLTEMLCSRWGLKAIDSVGKEFDPNLHEALAMEESGDCKVPTVLENFQTGYTLHQRVLRPARVKVLRPASK